MVTKESLKVLESKWVRQKRDAKGNETWGHELVEGAPESVRTVFEELQRQLALEKQMHGQA